MHEEDGLSRRELLTVSLAMGGVILSGSLAPVFAQSAVMTPTSEQAMGPFYPVIKPADQDADLTTIQGKPGRAQGQAMRLSGRVMTMKGQPVPGAQVEIWQANTFGRYTHPNDTNAAPLDPNFTGYGISITDTEGFYRFKTIKPAPYPASTGWTRPPHIHFQVTDRALRLVTQMYFPGEPLNEKDRLFKTAEDKATLLLNLIPPAKEGGTGELIASWNIILMRT